MYLAVIDVMIVVGKNDWDDEAAPHGGARYVPKGTGVWAKCFDVEIDILNSQAPEDPLQLTTSDAITGLWETVVEAAEASLYCFTVLTLRNDYRDIRSTVTIKEANVAAASNSTDTDADTFSTRSLSRSADMTLTRAAPVNLTAAPPYPAGGIVNPKNNQLSIMYTYTNTQIKSRDILLAMTGLFADAAQYAPSAWLKTRQQVSSSGKCAISLVPFLAPDLVTFGFATRALTDLIYLVMLPLEKFEEMTFVLEFHRYRMAEGHIQAMSPAPGIAAEEEWSMLVSQISTTRN